MPTKNFEQPVISFQEVQDNNGVTYSFPIVGVFLTTPQNQRIRLPLLFDTGASCTVLMASLYPLLGLQSWDQGIRRENNTANGMAVAYEYTVALEVLGKSITCPLQLMNVTFPPLYVGLLGRHNIFNQFGFGFWESSHELLVTNNP